MVHYSSYKYVYVTLLLETDVLHNITNRSHSMQEMCMRYLPAAPEHG